MKKFTSFLFVLFLCLSITAQKPQISKEQSQYAIEVSAKKVIRDLGSNTSSDVMSNVKGELSSTESQIGLTQYDLQSNSALSNRTYRYQDGSMAHVWTMGLYGAPAFAERGTGYNYFNGSDWADSPINRVEDERTGWPFYAPHGENGEIIVSHTGGSGLKLSYRSDKFTGDWTYSIHEGPAGAEGLTWPKIASSGENHQYLHIVANSYNPYMGQNRALLYSCTTDAGETWEDENIILPGLGSDEVNEINADDYIFASRGDVVALIVAGSWQDMILMKSEDNGENWTKTVIWDNPYGTTPIADIITTDTMYSPDGSTAAAIDSEGKVHVAFGLSRVLKEEAGDTWSYFPFTDAVIYWNEEMEPFEADNQHNALSHDNLVEDVTYVGWTPDVDDNGTLDIATEELYSYRTGGMATQVTMEIDQQDNIFLLFTAPREDLFSGVYKYRHIFGRAKQGNTWGEIFDITDGAIHLFDECIYPQMTNILPGDENIHLFYQRDNTPGLALDDDHDWVDNKIIHMEVPKTDFGISILESPNNLVANVNGFDVELTWEKPSGYDPLGYYIYRNGNKINTSIVADENYTDNGVSTGSHSYYVTALYQAEESGASNIVEVDITSYFTPVWFGNAFQPMTFMIGGATLDGLQLEAGDEIGIFDGDKCVGAGTLDHTLDPTNHQDYIQITAAKDDGSGNGYTESNPVIYKFWDGSEELEAGVSNVIFPYNPDYTYETFTSLATTFALLEAQSTIDHQTTYQAGWNMTSFAVEPEENNLQSILQPIIDNGELVKVIDEQGNIIEEMPWGWVNNIGAMSPSEGYYVKVTADNSVTTTGAPVELPYDIPLISGWNMMGYPSMTPQDATGALAELMDNSILIKVIDEQGNIIENMPWGWVNNIGSFQAGEGYYIKVTEDAMLTIEEPATRTGQLSESYKAPIANHFTPVYQGNPYEPMQVVVDASSLNLQQGDELALYSDKKCVGAAGFNPDSSYQYLTASKDDNQTAGQDGYLEGTPVVLKVYRKEDHTVYHVPYERIEGPTGYEPLQTKIVRASNLTTGIDDEQVQSVILYQNKPNPLKDKTIISYYLPESGEVSLSIVNLHGQEQLKLVEQTQKSGLHKVELDGNSLSPGIYLYRLNYKSENGKQQQLYKKMTIVR